MFRASWKYLVIGLVLVATLTMVAPQADARCCGWGGYAWGGWAWGGCGWGGCGWYAPYYGCGYRGCGWRSCGCYGCGYSCGYCGYDCCTTCGVSVDCGCGYVGTTTVTTTPSMVPQAPTPAKKPEATYMPTEPAPAPNAPAAPAPSAEPGAPAMPAPVPSTPPKTSGMSADESGVLTVWVPYDAKVTVNGMVTKSTGSRRQFVSYGLKSGLSYKYVIKAQVVRDGKTVEDSQTVVLTAGQVTAVAFGFNAPAAEQVAVTK